MDRWIIMSTLWAYQRTATWQKILCGKLSLPGKEILSAFLASVELRVVIPIIGLAI